MEKKSNSNNDGPVKVLMFPWLAHGHITPFLELSKKLIPRNFEVFLCSTRAALSSVKEPGKVKLIELNLPETKMPKELHTTNGLPPHMMKDLKITFEMGADEFARILGDIKPDLVVYDSLQPWAPEAAKKLGIPAVLFIANGVTMSAYMLHSSKYPGKKFPFPEIKYHKNESHIEETNRDLELSPTDENRNWVREGLERSSRLILIKSVAEIEGKYISYLSKLSRKKVFPIVPSPTNPPLSARACDIIQWLDTKKKRSTVYVAFGSECFLDERDRFSLAKGLELSGANFVWVIRAPVGQSFELTLPDGFRDRVGDRGKIVTTWAPQARILSHSSIAGFVSHCGWNSVLESMDFGVPIIAIPMHLDQCINARVVGSVGIGVEPEKDEGLKIQGEKLACEIRAVIDNGDVKGRMMRRKVQELKTLIEAKGDVDIDVVASELVRLCQTFNKTKLDFVWKLGQRIHKVLDLLDVIF